MSRWPEAASAPAELETEPSSSSKMLAAGLPKAIWGMKTKRKRTSAIFISPLLGTKPTETHL